MCSYSMYTIFRSRLLLKLVDFHHHRCCHDAGNVIVNANENLQRLIKVAIIGMPNSGKSTLINNMMDRKVCATSSKVHTTRKRTNAIITEGNTQVVFLDTPGIVNLAEKRRYNLERSFLKDCDSSVQETDLIGVVHDASNKWTREKLDIKIISLLERNVKKPSFLILNKIDELKSKRVLLDLIKSLTTHQKVPHGTDVKVWPHFQEIFMISALNGDGVDDIKHYLIRESKYKPWMYPSTEWTNQSPEEIIVNTAKATLLDFLPQEIPYKLRTEMEFFSTSDEGRIRAIVLIHCPSERIKKLISGTGDGKLRQITEKIHRDLQFTFQTHVSIQLVLKPPVE